MHGAELYRIEECLMAHIVGHDTRTRERPNALPPVSGIYAGYI